MIACVETSTASITFGSIQLRRAVRITKGVLRNEPVKNLCVSIDNKVILDNLNFELAPSGRLIIIGPNGAGKTVLLKALLNLLPYSGEITLGSRCQNWLCASKDRRRSPPAHNLQRPLRFEMQDH